MNAIKVFLICCLLQGSLCQEWGVVLPKEVKGLSRSCVVVPCSFTVPPEWEERLDDSCKGVWKQGSWRRAVVFDSSLTGASATFNILQGNLTGNLREKDCTTIFNNVPTLRDSFYFRLECDNPLKFNFHSSVIISTQDSLPGPTISPSKLEVEEGSPVRVSCSAVATCPVLPPTLTWTSSIGDIEESMEAGFMTSVMNFTAFYLQDGQKFLCIVNYNQQSGGSDLVYETTLTLRVLYPPNNTTVVHSGPVNEGSSVTLTCNANANPAVDDFTWYKVGGDEVTLVGLRKTLSTTVSEVDRQFYCTASNRYGAQNSSIAQIEVLFPPKDTTVVVELDGPLVEGSSVSLLCESRANPPVTSYTWYKDGGEDLGSGAELVLDRVVLGHSGGYHCVAQNQLGEEASAQILLDVQYPPKNTSVSPDPSGPVPDGSSVTLTCVSVANPTADNFTWFRTSGSGTEAVASEQDFTFNVTKLSEDQFYCEARNVHGSTCSEPVSLDVTFAPEILPSSSCVRILSQVRCSCESQGNPLPSLLWELAGDLVNHSADIPIREFRLEGVDMRSRITLYHVNDNVPSLVCISTNTLGSDSFTFNVSSSETQLGIHIDSLLIGSAAGALGMLLVCVPVLLCFCRHRKRSLSPHKGADVSDFVVTNGTNSKHVDMISAKKATLELEAAEAEGNLHYAQVNFVKHPAESKFEKEEIRGLDSKTEEYAQICVPAGGHNGVKE
ncbi:uncharacterized protein V6R79_010629 [Siganus canaliculatus]